MVAAISTANMPKKVVYSREDILHENAGKGGAQSSRRSVKSFSHFSLTGKIYF